MNNCIVCKGMTKIWMRDLFDDRHGFPGLFNVYKCSKCGFSKTEFKTSKKKNAELYKKYYPRQNFDAKGVRKEDYQVGSRFRLWRKGLLFNAQHWVKPGSTVLDVGCGLGFGLMELEGMSCKAYGIDPDRNVLRVAKKLKLNIKIGTMEDNLFKNKKFDYIIANQVLEHLDEPAKFLRLCKKSLKKGGKIILSLPNTDSLTRRMLGRNWLHWHIPYHLNHFGKKSMETVANKTGLKIEKLITISPNLWTGLQIRRLVLPYKMGTRDPFWDGEKPKNGKNDEAMKDNALRKYFKIIEEYFFPNRVADLMGLGESFLVILSK